MDIRYSANQRNFKHYTTEELRNEFLILNLYQPAKVVSVYSHVDRMVTLGCMPVDETVPLEKDMDVWHCFGTEFFLERREIGIFNIGNAGKITVDGTVYSMNNKDCLYITRGAKEVLFSSDDASAPAKGGLKMLTKNIASEFGAQNIQCNGIGPGYIATPQTAPLRESQPDGSKHPFDQFICSRTPTNRWGTTEDLVGPAIFLASDASNFVNGQILYVDGGILGYIGRQP